MDVSKISGIAVLSVISMDGFPQNKRRKIGICGGTFNPIHFGHINLAIEIRESHGLDEVWFCPAKISPHKLENRPISVLHRLKMIKIALGKIPGFTWIDLEVKKKGPSYTIDTLRELIAQQQKKNSPCDFSLILGADSISSFFDWHRPEEIVQLVPLLIGERNSILKKVELKGDPTICQAIEKGMTPIHSMDISSSQIRHRLSHQLYCGHLLPAEVLDYIYTNHLYLTPRVM